VLDTIIKLQGNQFALKQFDVEKIGYLAWSSTLGFLEETCSKQSLNSFNWTSSTHRNV